MKEDAKLDELIRQSQEAVKRLDDLTKKSSIPITQRVGQHFRKHGTALINVALAGSVLVVAMGRLGQKYQHQAAEEEWRQRHESLARDKRRAEEQLGAAEALLRQVEAEVAGAGGKGGLAKVRGALAGYWAKREPQAGQQQPAAAAAAGEGRQPPGGKVSHMI